MRNRYNRCMRPLAIAALSSLMALALCACPEAKPGGVNAAIGSGDASQAMTSSAVPQTPPQGAQRVTLKTTDGWQLAGWYWTAAAKPAPGIILLHQRGKDKSSWGNFPALLVKQGYNVLAIDLRGHGESLAPGGRHIGVDDLQDADYAAMLKDVAAADQFLSTQPGVDSDRIGIIGASIGANLAIMYLAGDRRVRTAVCLSPGLDFRGLRPMEFMKQVDKRPLYLIASKGDDYSAKTADALSQAGVVEGPKSLRLFDGKAHGTDMLAANPGLAQTIAGGWLLNYLPPKR